MRLALDRFGVLELAEKLGNVTEACRQKGVSRTQFYEWKRRLEADGLQGLADLPPVHRTHPQTTPPEVVEKLLALSLEHPAWGCDRLSDTLGLRGLSVSSPTAQSILLKHGMGSRRSRLLRLEEEHLARGFELAVEQLTLIVHANPCFAERPVESSRPGELLCQNRFYVGQIQGAGKLYLEAVVDTFSSYAFGLLHSGKEPEASVVILSSHVLPFYNGLDLKVGTMLTHDGRRYCGTERHPYEICLTSNGIEHRATRKRHPYTNGFAERFRRTVLDEFFSPALRATTDSSAVELQAGLDKWLVHYNTQRPHQGYRNLGKRPIDGIHEYLLRPIGVTGGA